MRTPRSPGTSRRYRPTPFASATPEPQHGVRPDSTRSARRPGPNGRRLLMDAYQERGGAPTRCDPAMLPPRPWPTSATSATRPGSRRSSSLPLHRGLAAGEPGPRCWSMTRGDEAEPTWRRSRHAARGRRAGRVQRDRGRPAARDQRGRARARRGRQRGAAEVRGEARGAAPRPARDLHADAVPGQEGAGTTSTRACAARAPRRTSSPRTTPCSRPTSPGRSSTWSISRPSTCR